MDFVGAGYYFGGSFFVFCFFGTDFTDYAYFVFVIRVLEFKRHIIPKTGTGNAMVSFFV